MPAGTCGSSAACLRSRAQGRQGRTTRASRRSSSSFAMAAVDTNAAPRPFCTAPLIASTELNSCARPSCRIICHALVRAAVYGAPARCTARRPCERHDVRYEAASSGSPDDAPLAGPPAHVSTRVAAGSTSVWQMSTGTPALQAPASLLPATAARRGARRGRRAPLARAAAARAAPHHGDVEVAPEDAVRAQRRLLRGLHGGAAVERHERERVQLRHVHSAARRQAVPRRHHQRELVLRGRAGPVGLELSHPQYLMIIVRLLLLCQERASQSPARACPARPRGPAARWVRAPRLLAPARSASGAGGPAAGACSSCAVSRPTAPPLGAQHTAFSC
jgi:hypothetical protein